MKYQTNAKQATSSMQDLRQIERLHNTLKGYKTSKRLQQATISYIVENLTSHDELISLQKAFNSINVSNTGTITKDELIRSFNVEDDDE